MWYHELKIQLFLRYRELTQYAEVPFSEVPIKYIFPFERDKSEDIQIQIQLPTRIDE